MNVGNELPSGKLSFHCTCGYVCKETHAGLPPQENYSEIRAVLDTAHCNTMLI
jgi:hypothetical protein